MIKGKKGIESQNWAPTDTPMFILFGFLAGVAAIVFVIFVASPQSEAATIKGELDTYFLIDRFVKSPNCFALYDEITNIVYKWTLDYGKFSDLQLDDCMKGLIKGDAAFRVTLNSPEASVLGLPKTAKTKFWNDNRPVEKIEQPQTVSIFYLGREYKGEILIELQNIKS